MDRRGRYADADRMRASGRVGLLPLPERDFFAGALVKKITFKKVLTDTLECAIIQLSRGEKGTNPRRALMGSGFKSHVRTLTNHETF